MGVLEGLYEGPLRCVEDLPGAGIGSYTVSDALGDRFEDCGWVVGPRVDVTQLVTWLSIRRCLVKHEKRKKKEFLEYFCIC